VRFESVLPPWCIRNKTCICFFRTGSSAFSATDVAVIPGTTNIRFPSVIINTGGDYSSSTGVFTCRVPGLYWFSATIGKAYSIDVDFVPCWIMLNGVLKIYMFTDPHGGEHDLGGYTSTGSVAFHLRPGDRVQVGRCTLADFIWNNESTHFSGMLVIPDV